MHLVDVGLFRQSFHRTLGGIVIFCELWRNIIGELPVSDGESKLGVECHDWDSAMCQDEVRTQRDRVGVPILLPAGECAVKREGPLIIELCAQSASESLNIVNPKLRRRGPRELGEPLYQREKAPPFIE